ncbi:MAG: metallophosphoesterase [Lachnospiraceae bacterium]|nr:metallophosphoesterase [Lachnospiraceae bacterium]
MKKQWKPWLVMLLLLCACTMTAACGDREQEHPGVNDKAELTESEMAGPDHEMRSTLTVWVATDIHYLSRELYDDSPIFVKTLEQGDGKLTERMPEILDIFVDQVLTARPDALVLAGDLTFNGEKQSLQELMERMDEIRQAGIPVLVIPGNHDKGQYMAVSYLNNMLGGADTFSEDDFQQICGPYGYDQAVCRDESSMSYLYDLTEDVQLILLDVNMLGDDTPYTRGSLPASTLTWLEAQLAAASAAGKTVLTVSHQNVLPQNSLLYYGYAMYNYEEVSALLQKYGVTVNVSGHSHIQHMVQEGGLRDHAVGPLSVTPLRYGVLTIDEERNIQYESASLTEPASSDVQIIPVSEAAKELVTEAEQRYQMCQHRRVMEMLEGIQQRQGFSDAEQEIMASFMVTVNQAYVTGEMVDQNDALESEGWRLWTKYCQEDFWWQYLHDILTES